METTCPTIAHGERPQGIVCTGLTKTYAKKRILDEINLTIGPGLCALLGANGAGKSTLLRLMSGLEKPDEGDVTVCGMRFHAQGIEIKKRMGVVPEGLGLFESMSILENLLAVGPIYGLKSRESELRALDLLHVLDLTHSRNTIVRECSFGMRKKTALAMALLYKPSVLLLDEPFEGIDPASSTKIQGLLKQLAAEGAAVLITSHIFSIVKLIADRVIILYDGKIALDLDPEQIKTGVEDAYFRIVGKPRLEIPRWLQS